VARTSKLLAALDARAEAAHCEGDVGRDLGNGARERDRQDVR
jgi:hypothetical protein